MLHYSSVKDCSANLASVKSMKIAFSCRCGQRMQAKDENSGKKVRCPSCNAIVLVPEADKFDSEVYSLAAASGRVVPGGKIVDRERSAASVRETSPRHTDRAIANEPFNGAPAAGVEVGSTREGEHEGPARHGRTHWTMQAHPRSFRRRHFRANRDRSGKRFGLSLEISKIRRLASRGLNVVGWICIAVAGLQSSVFVGEHCLVF